MDGGIQNINHIFALLGGTIDTKTGEEIAHKNTMMDQDKLQKKLEINARKNQIIVQIMLEMKNSIHKDLYADLLEIMGQSYVPTDLNAGIVDDV